MMSVQIKAEYNQPIKMKPVNKSGSALGALERLSNISTRKWSVGPSFFQKQIAHDDEWLFFAH